MKKVYIVIILLISLTVACEGGNTDMDNAIEYEGGNTDMDNAIENKENENAHIDSFIKELESTIKESDFDKLTRMAERVDFDYWNTFFVLSEVFKHEFDAALVTERLHFAGVRGAVRAKWIEQNRHTTSILEIESEDNVLYRLAHDGITTISIREATGGMIWQIPPEQRFVECGGFPIPLPPLKNHEVDFDLDNTLQVIYDAIGKVPRYMESQAGEFFLSRRVNGVIHAEVIENIESFISNSNNDEIYLKIETEDKQQYILALRSPGPSLGRIIDIETGYMVFRQFDEFDSGNTLRVIGDALNIDINSGRSGNVVSAVTSQFPNRNIKGAIYAELVDDIEDCEILKRVVDPSHIRESDVLLKIETEDNKQYLLVLMEAPNYSFRRVIDLETGEIVSP